VLDKNNSLLKIYEDIFFSNNEPIALNNTNEYSEKKNKIEKQDEIKGDEKKILTDKKLTEDRIKRKQKDIIKNLKYSESIMNIQMVIL